MSRLYECDHCGKVQKEQLNNVAVHIGNCFYGSGEYCDACKKELIRLLHDWTGKAILRSL